MALSVVLFIKTAYSLASLMDISRVIRTQLVFASAFRGMSVSLVLCTALKWQ